MLSTIMKTKCIESFYYYVCSDSECHSNCGDFFGCDCISRPVPEMDEGTEIDELEVADCCLLRREISKE